MKKRKGGEQSFEPTYKELKPVNANSPSCKELCFEPTYKELKLFLMQI